MSRPLWSAGALLAFLTAVISDADPDGVTWETDLAAATATAAREGRPLLVVFRCPP